MLDDHKDHALILGHFGFSKLSEYFPDEVLDRVRVVTVPKPPSPPLTALGLPELFEFEQMSQDGITYLNTTFLREGQVSESLCFHELGHVVQWSTLGADRFLLAYGVGLVQFGYERSSLERMAYDFQEAFERGTTLPKVVQEVQDRTNGIWSQVAPIIAQTSMTPAR